METWDMWHLTPDTWNLTPDTWHMTHDMWHVVGYKHYIKILPPLLLQFGCNDVLRFEGKFLLKDLVTKVFLEQPRLHRVC